MTIESAKVQAFASWQVFNAARKYLGAAAVARIFNRSLRSAHDWAQDPACTAVRCKSPLECLHALFERLDAAGMGYVARAALAYLESALAPEHGAEALCLPLPTLEQEVLADFRSVAALQAAVEAGAEMDMVAALADEAKAEIERTVARYIKLHREYTVNTGGGDDDLIAKGAEKHGGTAGAA